MKRAILMFFLAAMAAGCSGGRRADKAPLDDYDILARRISEAGAGMSNRKVAVLPFSYTDRRESEDGTVISERLLTRIIQTGRLEVVERALLERIMEELKLQYSGAVDETSIKRLGRILGVEAVVTGTLTRTSDGRIEINARMIRAENAVVLSAAAATVLPDWETAAGPRETETSGPEAAQPSPAAAAQTGDFPKGWKYRENFRVAEKSGSSLVDYQLLVNFDSSEPIRRGRMKADCSDLRFANSNETSGLNYWIEGGCNTGETRVWLRVPFLARNSVKNIYMYYGNPEAAAASSGEAVFPLFDDFNDNAVDASKWQVIRGECPLNERNGRLEVSACTGGNSATIDWLMTARDVPAPHIIEFTGLAPASGSSGQFHSIALRWGGSVCGVYNNPAGGLDLTLSDGIVPPQYPVLRWVAGDCDSGESARAGSYIAPNTWHRYRITDDAKRILLHYDDELIMKGEPGVHGGERFAFRGRNAPIGYDVYYDDIRVRKYAAVEPEVYRYSPGTKRSYAQSRQAGRHP